MRRRGVDGQQFLARAAAPRDIEVRFDWARDVFSSRGLKARRFCGGRFSVGFAVHSLRLRVIAICKDAPSALISSCTQKRLPQSLRSLAMTSAMV